MMKGKEYKLEKDLNTKYHKNCTLCIFKSQKKNFFLIPNRLTKNSTTGVLKGWLFNR